MASARRITLRLKAALGLLPKVARITVNTLAYSSDRHDSYIKRIELLEEIRFEAFSVAEESADAHLLEPVIVCSQQIEKTARTRFNMRMTDRRRHNYLKDRRTHNFVGRPRSLRELNMLLPQSA